MAANKQQPSLQTHPTKLLTVIAIHLAATSDQPMEDLGRLRATCTVMRRVCGQCAVGRRVALLRCWEEMQWNQPGRYYSLLRLLVDVGNPEASLLTRIPDFFGGYQLSLDQLSRAAAGRLNVAAYLYTLMLYRNAGGVTADDMAKMYIRRLEGEEGMAATGSIGPKMLHNFVCRECCRTSCTSWCESCGTTLRCRRHCVTTNSPVMEAAPASLMAGEKIRCFAARIAGYAMSLLRLNGE
uniref:Uncharacterized protein n=1 Tax=Setaria italica TaxID=4555 RepID=K3ZM16_SETIT